jgi:hypothetical protein
VAFEPDPTYGHMVARKRKIEWREDIVASGDCAHIQELHLVTPQGDAYLLLSEPHTAIQMSRGTLLPLHGGIRIKNMQLIGRVDNRETGACTAVIWDVQEQKLYPDFQTTVKDFAAWRDGVIPVGAMNTDVMGVRLY